MTPESKERPVTQTPLDQVKAEVEEALASSQPYLSTPCDKTSWLPGPWQDEEDLASWQDTLTGYRLAMLRHPHFGHWCGYVKLPPSHPLCSLSYSAQVPAPPDLANRPVDIDALGAITVFCSSIKLSPDLSQASIDLQFPCHGGLTYSDGPWFGFDCSHSHDLAPGMDAKMKELGCPIERPWQTYRDAPYVRGVLTQLAKAFWDYAAWRAESHD